MTTWDGPGLDAWRAWTPSEMAARLAGIDVTWCVVGGWSIDCFLGRETRVHEDLEVAVLRPEWSRVRRALSDLVLHAVGDGEVRALGPHEEPPERVHQSWALDPVANEWRVDVMMEPGDATTWAYRRDESFTAPRDEIVGTTDDGIPYLHPRATLLFKAKYQRPKDEADLEVVLPHLEAADRSWLRGALERFHPGHPWLGVV